MARSMRVVLCLAQVAGAHPDQMTRVAELLEKYTKVGVFVAYQGVSLELEQELVSCLMVVFVFAGTERQ